MKEVVRLVGGMLLLFLACWYSCASRQVNRSLTQGPTSLISRAAPQPVSFTSERQGGKLVLRGVLPDAAARQRLLAKAQEVFGAAQVSEEALQTGGLVEAGWVAGALGLLSAAKLLGDGGSIMLTSETLTVRGTVAEAATRLRILQQATAELPAACKLNDLLTLTSRPLETAALQTQSQLNLILAPGIEFAAGKASIATTSAETLSAAAAVLRATTALPVEIGCHTDNQGDAGTELALSLARANAVKKFLVMQGVAAEQLTAKGYGSTQPIAANNTEAGRQRNRRVELRIRSVATGLSKPE